MASQAGVELYALAWSPRQQGAFRGLAAARRLTWIIDLPAAALARGLPACLHISTAASPVTPDSGATGDALANGTLPSSCRGIVAVSAG